MIMYANIFHIPNLSLIAITKACNNHLTIEVTFTSDSIKEITLSSSEG